MVGHVGVGVAVVVASTVACHGPCGRQPVGRGLYANWSGMGSCRCCQYRQYRQLIVVRVFFGYFYPALSVVPHPWFCRAGLGVRVAGLATADSARNIPLGHRALDGTLQTPLAHPCASPSILCLNFVHAVEGDPFTCLITCLCTEDLS